ncbi:MAG: hypothetical protein ABJA33_04950 [Pedococcus sp.]
MAEHEDWTADDDAQLRGAFATLREDVEAVPLPDVRFVRARGVRRRRQRALALTAAAAAAAVGVGAVGYGQLGRDGTLPLIPATQATASVPATQPPTQPTTSATADLLSKPGALPLVTDWTSALGLTGTVRLTPVKPFEAVECLDVEPGTKVQQESLSLDAGGPSGGQVRFTLASGTDPETAASGVANDISDCALAPGFRVNGVVATGAGSLYPYTAGDAGSGWFAIVHGQRDLTVLQVVDPDHATAAFTREQVEALATTAQQRLERYGTGSASSTSGSSSAPGVGPTGSTRALSEDMPVAGPQPVPTSPLFVAASQWRAQGFRGNAATTAGPRAGASTGVIACEDDNQQSGVAGRVGVVNIQAGTGQKSSIGQQRVRVFQDVRADELVAADLTQPGDLALKGCSTPDGVRTVGRAGPSEGTYLLTTTSPGGTVRQWVGVTAMKTPGAVSTIVFMANTDGQGFTGGAGQGFAELDRLLALARQK